MAMTEEIGSGATRSTASAESRVNVASPHSSGGKVARNSGRFLCTRHLLWLITQTGAPDSMRRRRDFAELIVQPVRRENPLPHLPAVDGHGSIDLEPELH